MKCEEIMKRDVECVGPQDSVGQAAKLMRDEEIGFLPVCDSGRKVIGAITDRDLAIRVLADDKAASTPVSQAMSREVVSCHPSDDVREAEELLAKHKKSRIMCVDDADRLVGVISLSDIAQLDEDRQVARTLREVTEREAPQP